MLIQRISHVILHSFHWITYLHKRLENSRRNQTSLSLKHAGNVCWLAEAIQQRKHSGRWFLRKGSVDRQRKLVTIFKASWKRRSRVKWASIAAIPENVSGPIRRNRLAKETNCWTEAGGWTMIFARCRKGDKNQRGLFWVWFSFGNTGFGQWLWVHVKRAVVTVSFS